jgi:ATP-dependent 26S proteasome regulatory subunit
MFAMWSVKKNNVHRFDREISMEPPNTADRYALFQTQINKMPLDKDVDVGKDFV